ncbi:hypothetical protein B0H15DRAFT_823665 [Mycena belliarum]|uniref:Sfi1 spindle body domain-containing protein n=1 Tax=Mycena belliarum TaxID=1033014 RepID=A0AAD6UG64_9AGAR|nr:hypothetical protein B0H15DRAFT_823665 [Mycena belliae]
MSSFRPTRASPPSKLATSLTDSVLHSTLSADLSRSSTLSIRELLNLTQEDVDLLDAIIARAGASATTFPAVFTAYNTVLKERGLDPSEVIFYGKLLKLGTLKGANWGEKWRMVKLQQGYVSAVRSSRASKSANNPTLGAARVTLPLRVPRHADSLTVHSHENESTHLNSDGEDRVSDVDVPQYHMLNSPAGRRPASPVYSEATSTGFDTRNYPLLTQPSRSRPMPPARQRIWEADKSDATEHRGSPSTTPPSYRAAVRDSAPFHEIAAHTAGKRPISSASLATARQLVARARERKGSVVNEDDAWKKIKMLQDEKHADAFRQDRLLEQCWQVWKQGFRWIITTSQQIGEARDKILLEVSIKRWRARTAESRELCGRVATLANYQVLHDALRKWKERTRERQQARWRASMRAKMKLVRDKRESKLMKDALAKWRKLYRSQLAEQRYATSIASRYYGRWRKQVVHLDHLDDAADEFSRQIVEVGVLERCWYLWKHKSHLQLAHRMISGNVGLRVKAEVMDVWRTQIRDNHAADAYHANVLKRGAIRSWKAARDKIWTTENHADQFRDRFLSRTTYVILRTRYQDRRLKAMTNAKRMKEAWEVWKTRVRQHQRAQDLALTFSLRLSSPLAKATLRKWYEVHFSHRNARSHAVVQYSNSLRSRALLSWQLKLRRQLKLRNMARSVDKFFVARSAWHIFKAKFAERMRQRSLKALELRKTQEVFYEWFSRAHRQRVQKLAEESIMSQITERILRTTLTRWMNHTIDLKNRELQVAEDRDAWLVKLAYKKWKGVRGRHVEEVSLLESYQFVKRDENIRKIFHRWLGATRTIRHRRLTLERKEADIKFGAISVAWDKWRERYKHQSLQPVEYGFILESHRNTLARAFARWHYKTKSLPAIRFNTSRMKARYWKTWLKALPRALKAKAAREMERKAIFSKFLDKWLQALRTKMALKAVARARYLRLPAAPIRPTSIHSRPVPTAPVPVISRSMFPRRAPRTEEESSEGGEGPGRATRRLAGPRSLRSDTSPPRRSQSRFSIPATRASSPTRSSLGMRLSREAGVSAFPTRPARSVAEGERRGRLFHEKQESHHRIPPPHPFVVFIRLYYCLCMLL